MSKFHEHLEKLAGEDSALILSHDALRRLLLGDLVEAAKRLHGVGIVPIDKFPGNKARFVDLTIGSNNHPVDRCGFKLHPFEKGEKNRIQNRVDARVPSDFALTIALYAADGTKLELSAISINIIDEVGFYRNDDELEAQWGKEVATMLKQGDDRCNSD